MACACSSSRRNGVRSRATERQTLDSRTAGRGIGQAPCYRRPTEVLSAIRSRRREVRRVGTIGRSGVVRRDRPDADPREPPLSCPNEPDPTRRAPVTATLAFHRVSQGSGARCVPHVLLGNPRVMTSSERRLVCLPTRRLSCFLPGLCVCPLRSPLWALPLCCFFPFWPLRFGQNALFSILPHSSWR